jgi:hypothetical protein
VRLLIACLAYQVMHIARHALTKATGTGWSLRRLRERVLRAVARMVISGRRMTLAHPSAAAPFWAVLWPGSPPCTGPTRISPEADGLGTPNHLGAAGCHAQEMPARPGNRRKQAPQ